MGSEVASVDKEPEVEVAKGYTMTQLCDKMIEYFMNEKPKTKDWRKVLVFRDEWKKYKDSFYKRCQVRADAEQDIAMRQNLEGLARKMKKVKSIVASPEVAYINLVLCGCLYDIIYICFFIPA